MGWTRLDAAIVQSSIWDLDAETCKVWVTMLALANRDGVVESSLPGLAHAARVSVERTAAALAAFLDPDPYSRSPDNDGRRIERVRGGWRLLNHSLYRFSERELATMRQQRYRARQADAGTTTEQEDRGAAVLGGGGGGGHLVDASSRSVDESVTPSSQAKQMEQARRSVACTECGKPWRLIHGRDGDFYGHGSRAGVGGCRATCPVSEYQERASAAPAKLCSRCGERQVLGPGYERGEDLCGPCQIEVTRGR